MEENTRIAIAAVIVEDPDAVEEMNGVLHEYSVYIIGRMGIPHPSRDLSVISVALEADQDTISALSGKLGALPGVSTKTIYAKK